VPLRTNQGKERFVVAVLGDSIAEGLAHNMQMSREFQDKVSQLPQAKGKDVLILRCGILREDRDRTAGSARAQVCSSTTILAVAGSDNCNNQAADTKQPSSNMTCCVRKCLNLLAPISPLHLTSQAFHQLSKCYNAKTEALEMYLDGPY
jgi:hypothetical protein